MPSLFHTLKLPGGRTHRLMVCYEGDKVLDIKRVDVMEFQSVPSMEPITHPDSALRQMVLQLIDERKIAMAGLHEDYMELVEVLYEMDHGRDARLDDTGDPDDSDTEDE